VLGREKNVRESDEPARSITVRTTLYISLVAGLGLSFLGVVAFSAYMLSLGAEPPYWVLLYSIPAGVAAAVILAWLLTPRK
jgi:hypothetical protein